VGIVTGVIDGHARHVLVSGRISRDVSRAPDGDTVI